MKKNKNGISLIELLIVMSIIGILTLGASKISFNKSIDKQNSLIFSNNISTNIESIRNNSLLGKGIINGTNMVHPNKWVINIKTSVGGTGSIDGYYLEGAILKKYNDFKINFINSYSKIEKLTCYNIDRTISSIPSNIDLEIVGSSLSLSGCTSPNNKILDINTTYKGFNKIIRINSISGVIEKVDN